MLTHNWIFVGKNGELICNLVAEDGKSEPVIICSSGPVISVRENGLHKVIILCIYSPNTYQAYNKLQAPCDAL